MPVHLKEVNRGAIVVEMRIYDGDPEVSYRKKMDYTAVVTALVCQVEDRVDFEAAHGRITIADAREALNLIRDRYHVREARWERSSGKKVLLRWNGTRWRTIAGEIQNVEQ